MMWPPALELPLQGSSNEGHIYDLWNIFGSPGPSIGRAIVLPPVLASVVVSALAKC